jgi:hypothetical protein
VRRRLVVAVVALVLATVVAFAVPLAIAMTRLLESRALDGLQATTEQIARFLDFTARDCGELRLRVAQAGDAAEVTVVDSDLSLVATNATTASLRLGIEEVAEAFTGRVSREVGDGRLGVATLLTTAVCGRPLVLHAATPDTDLRRSLSVAWGSILAVAAVRSWPGASPGRSRRSRARPPASVRATSPCALPAAGSRRRTRSRSRSTGPRSGSGAPSIAVRRSPPTPRTNYGPR